MVSKKGLFAVLVALLLGIAGTQLLQAQDTHKDCCPACDPPEASCCNR